MAAAGTVMTFAPFVDWGKFLPNPSGQLRERQKVELPDGSQANVKTFPVNHSEAVIYPKTKDLVLNKESFRVWQFILWCLWKYWPQEGRKRGECPCHGSMYDPLTGQAFAGPASLQAPPNNVLPRLDLEIDTQGNMWVKPPNWSVNGNGIVGFGRFLT
jgi:ubiquinol-cytochrome c reductase iron-sulfur subunit